MGLRARFLIACGLLVMTTVAASAWTLGMLAGLTASAHALVKTGDEASNALDDAASALEREDDALLLVLSSDDHSQADLPAARLRVDLAMQSLARILARSGDPPLAEEAVVRIAAYREAVTRLLAEPLGDDPLDQYQIIVNPPLRLATLAVSRIRDRFFSDMMHGLSRSRDAVARTRGVAFIISALAILVAVGVALRLSREVIGPLRQFIQSANAIREGNFAARIVRPPGDELAEVADAFNHMAERLAEFHRLNLEEILRVKGTLEATLTALPDAVILFGPDGRILSTNPAATALLAQLEVVEPEQAAELIQLGLANEEIKDVLAGRDMPSSAVTLSGALRCEVRGEIHRLLPRIARTASEADGRCGAVLVLSDVTELARLDELRAEHIAVASHELRTPVTTLRMTLMLLEEASAELSPRVRDLVRTALGGVEQLSETVDELLDLARIEAGRLTLMQEPLDLTALVREVAERAITRAEDASVQLLLQTDTNLPTIRGDRARLRIVVDNLINNALKYTPVGGTVAVRVVALSGPADQQWPEQGPVHIEVVDTGPGIPVEFRTRVFEKFFRVELHSPEGAHRIRGVGIGLYLCKQIVELHAGRIVCEAGDAGTGTRMRIELPAA